jgi:hypothetical protein
MIRHVVVWRLLGESVEDKRQRFEVLAPELEALANSVPGVLSLSVRLSTGPNPKNWDMCLVSDHESWEALEIYANHPEHLAVAAKVADNVSERAGADFEV